SWIWGAPRSMCLATRLRQSSLLALAVPRQRKTICRMPPNRPPEPRQMGKLAAARSEHLFATPLLSHIWPDGAELNPVLRESILAHERSHPGTDQTNVGGWHSERGTLEFCGDAGQHLIAHMREMIEEATHRLFAEF